MSGQRLGAIVKLDNVQTTLCLDTERNFVATAAHRCTSHDIADPRVEYGPLNFVSTDGQQN